MLLSGDTREATAAVAADRGPASAADFRATPRTLIVTSSANVRTLPGRFSAGDAVAVIALDRGEVARGLTTMSAREVRRVAGLRSDQVRAALPHADEEVIHRDVLVLVSEEAQ